MDQLKNTADSLVQDRPRPNYFRSQWLLLGVALVLLGVIVIYQGYADYQTISRREENRLQTQTKVIALNIEHQLDATHLALKSIVDDIAYLRKYEALKLANRRLKALADAMPGIRTMFVLDAKGTVVASNREELIGRNFRTRDYFVAPERDHNPSVLYVSPPFKTVLGSFLINLSHVIPAADGSFDGVVTAALDPDYFRVLLSSVLYAPDMLSSINHGDGIRLMMVPELADQAGKSLTVSGTFFLQHRNSGRLESLLRGNSPSYPAERVMALRTVQPAALRMDKPLYVACSRNAAAIYADWGNTLTKQAVVFAAFSVAIMASLYWLQRRQRKLELQAARTQQMMQLRLELLEFAGSHDLQSLLRLSLDEITKLSSSPIGFYHFVEADQQTLSLQAWSTRTLQEFCTAKGHGMHYPVADAGVWADCVRQRRAIIHNNYPALPNRKGLPEGHAPVLRELVVPIFRADQVVAILGVGNKPVAYTDDDLKLITHLADIVWEITERKRDEEERQKLGLRYQTMQSVARDGIHILDLQGNLVESNAAFRQMLGYAAKENPTLNFTDWDVGLSRDELAAMTDELLHTPDIFETRYRRRDGTVFEVEVSVCGVQLDGDWYLYASSRDISKRKELESSLRTSRQQLSDIFDFLPDATFVVDHEKKVIAWNRAMEEMSGVSKQEILGQGDRAYSIPFYGERRTQLLDLIDLDDEELKTRYAEVTRLGSHLFAETYCPALYAGKGAYVWAVVAPLRDADGKQIGAIESIRDISAIKATEANLARSNQELEQFAYVASHDLQEPLRKIAGFTELLANRCKGSLDDKSESYMAYIVDGATRMRSLINDLLCYSRIMRSDREPAETDCAEVVSKVIQDMELAIGESQTEILCGPLPVILADRTQLGQLFQNLIGNGIKFRGAASPKITINAVVQGDDWLFSVADNGIGIAPEFYDRIFAIFQRLHTRAEYPGTGIGLAVCQKIVERHGGKIWVESTPGSGSTFFFTIPERQERRVNG